MPHNRDDETWAERVPYRRTEGPYRDYGWEAGQSGLPEFRDPSVHLTESELRRVPKYRRWAQGRADWPARQEAEPRWDWESTRYDYEPRFDQGWGYGTRFANEYEEDWMIPGPYTGLGPRNYRRSDERIREDVCERLTQHGWIDASNIEVRVENQEVILRGTVDSRKMKRMAEAVAETVTGISDIRNELRIRSSSRAMTSQEKRESGRPGGGQGRVDRVGRTGVYPASGPLPPGEAQVQPMKSWGQGERGAAGYEDHGESELHIEPVELEEEE